MLARYPYDKRPGVGDQVGISARRAGAGLLDEDLISKSWCRSQPQANHYN
jgi:hypothetical protein